MSLHGVINTGNLELIRTALAAGADVNELDGAFSVLEKAATFRNVELLRVLLDAGANPNLGHRPPLSVAIHARPSAELLIERGADLRNPKVFRSAMGSAETALWLLERGAPFVAEYAPEVIRAKGTPAERERLIGLAIDACSAPDELLAALVRSQLDELQARWVEALVAKGASLARATLTALWSSRVQALEVLVSCGASLDDSLQADWSAGEGEKLLTAGTTVREAALTFLRTELRTTDKARVKRLAQVAKALGVDPGGKPGARLASGTPLAPLKPRVTPPLLRNEALEARLEKKPDDASVAAAYAKWLTEHDNPHGALITAQLEGRDFKALLKRHAAVFLGPLTEFKRDRELRDEPNRSRWKDEQRGYALEWKHGFFSRLELRWDDEKGQDPARDLKAVLELPTARVLSELRLGPLPARGRTMSAQRALDALVETQAPARLRSLFLANIARWDWTDTNTGNFGAVHQHFPNLEQLTLNAGTVQLGANASLPELKVLSLQTHALTRRTLEDVLSLKAPKLERLSLWFGRETRGSTATLAQLAPILDGSRFPKLVHLGVMNCEWVGKAVSALATSKLLGRLHSLDLSMGCLTDDDVSTMQTHRAAFSRLEQLNLHDNGLTKKAQTAGLAKHVHLGKQDPKRATRYASVGE